MDHHKATNEALRVEGILYHSYAPRGTKRSKKWVLHGFDVDHPVEDILSELQSRLPGYRMGRRMMKKDTDGTLYNIEAIQVITDSTVRKEDIEKLKSLDQVRFRVSAFKESGEPVQCRKCQEFGHVMRYCGRHTACPWCGGEHLYQQCTKKASAPKCPKCGGDHPAFSRDCPERKKILESRKVAKAAVVVEVSSRHPSRTYNQGLTFSRIMGGAQSQSAKTLPPQHQQDHLYSSGYPLQQQDYPHHMADQSQTALLPLHQQNHPHHHPTQTTQTPSPSSVTSQQNSALDRLLDRVDNMMTMMTSLIKLLTQSMEKKQHD